MMRKPVIHKENFPRAASTTRREEQSGVAIIAVLWVLVLLSVLVASFTFTTRTEVSVARNLIDNAQAEALADAGIYRAIFGLHHMPYSDRLRADGSVYAFRFGDGEVRFTIRDEGGKIDLNTAPPHLLQRLFVAAGVDPGRIDALTDAIVDFRDPDDLRRFYGAEDPEYELADLAYGAKDGPFDTVDELHQVLGMDPALVTEILPALTVYSGLISPHEQTAPPLVRAALAGDVLPEEAPGEELPKEPTAEGETGTLDETPAIIREGSDTRDLRASVFSIHAEGRNATGAVFARMAVVAISRQSGAFALYDWRRARRELFPVIVRED